MNGPRLTAAPPGPALRPLEEEQVRDQLSAAEELLHLGHGQPALVAASAAIEGALRLRGSHLAGPTASSGALLEALLVERMIDDLEHERLYRALAARDHLSHGFAPRDEEPADPQRVEHVLGVALRLLG